MTAAPTKADSPPIVPAAVPTVWDARRWWSPGRLRANARAAAFAKENYAVRRWWRWKGVAYRAEEVFQVRGRRLCARKVPLRRLAYAYTLWSLKRPTREDARAWARPANRTRRAAIRAENPDVANPAWCFECGYPREGLSPDRPCPECGWRLDPGGAYLFPRENFSGDRAISVWKQWAAGVWGLVFLGLIVLISIGPPRWLPVPSFAWTMSIYGTMFFGASRLFGLLRRPDDSPTVRRTTLRVEPGDADGRPLCVRAPGSFDTLLRRDFVRKLRVERRLPNLYRIRRPLAWWRFGRRFSIHFEAGARQAARVEAALRRC